MFGWGARIESLGTSLLLSSLLSIIRKGHFLSPVRLSLTPRGHLQYCIFLLYLAFWPWHRLLCFAKGPFMDYVSTFLGFLDPPSSRKHVFGNENKQKWEFSDPPTCAYVMYEWSHSKLPIPNFRFFLSTGLFLTSDDFWPKYILRPWLLVSVSIDRPQSYK